MSGCYEEIHHKKSIPIPYVYKHLLRETIRQRQIKIIHEEAIFKHIEQSSRHFLTEKSVHEFFTRIPLSEILINTSTENTFFPCILIEKNFAWISTNQSGHSRYFTKSSDEPVWMMDIEDLFEIQYGLSQEEMMSFLVEYFHLQCEEYEWKQKQRQKYQNNDWFLSETLSSYSNLHQLISPLSTLLSVFNDYGKSFLFRESLSYQNQNLFFASSKQLSERLPEMSYSKANKCLNLFAVLGLIEKVPQELLPKEYYEKLIYSEKKMGKHSSVNFFIVHDFLKVAEESEKRAGLLLEHGVRYSNLSKSIVEKLFGESFAHKVYPQKIQKNRNRKKFQRKNIEKELEEHFVRLLNTRGYVTKGMLQDSLKGKFSKEKSRQYVQLIWSYLLQKYHCIYRKPTKAIKEKLSLTTNEYIAYQKEDEG